MTKQVYLKGKNSWALGLFISVNAAAFLCVCISPRLTYSSLEHFWQKVSAKDGLIAIGMPLVIIVLNGLFSATMKARLVFWRWANPLPGARVFTELVRTDHRINEGTLKNKYGKLPRSPKEQNALWYRIYKVHAEKVAVSESHKAYLLTRDMTGLSVIFAIMFLVGAFLVSVGHNVLILYGFVLLGQYLILAASARNYGKRFVLNVLAEESSS